MIAGSALAAAGLFLVSIFAAFLSTATGMGGGVIFFVSILHVYPLAVTIPVHGCVQMFANIARTIALRRHLRAPMCLPYLIGAVVGVFAVLEVMQYLTSEAIPYSIILALIIYSVFKPSRMPDLVIPMWAFGLVGVMAGFLAILIGTVDAFLSPFFIREDFTKEEVVANKSFMQAVIHVAKIPVFLSLGFSYTEYAGIIALLLLGSVLGILVGVRALQRLNRRIFLLSFKTILVLIGVRIAFRLWSLF